MRKIQVTKEHIDNGIRGNANACMIAYAVEEFLAKEGIPTPSEVEVEPYESSVVVYVPGYEPFNAGDSEISKMVTRWDDGYEVEPFEIDVPDTLEKNPDSPYWDEGNTDYFGD